MKLSPPPHYPIPADQLRRIFDAACPVPAAVDSDEEGLLRAIQTNVNSVMAMVRKGATPEQALWCLEAGYIFASRHIAGLSDHKRETLAGVGTRMAEALRMEFFS